MRIVIALLAALAATAPTALAQDVVAARTLRAGIQIAAADLRALTELGVDLVADFDGLETRRSIFSGTAVYSRDLGPPTVVNRNDIVVMHLNTGILDLRTEGRALSEGPVGSRIRVMNLSSRIAVHAVITGPGTVEVAR